MPVLNTLAADSETFREWRQDFHRHPEIGYEEIRTAATIADKLRGFGFDEVHEGIGQTGVVGVLHGRTGPGDEANSIMLRSDIDALPMLELNGFAHKSTIHGKMHACGHDGHMTMLLAAARQLAGSRSFEGTAYFCFQPAEEGGAGAAAMIADGLFERFPCRAIYGMHNWPGVPVGSFETRSGPLLASADEFKVTVTGQGGHAAQPHRCKDPVVCAAQIITALQTVVSRRTNPNEPVVVSVTQLNAGEAFNVIPETVEMIGTLRCFDMEVKAQVYAEIERIINGVASAHDMAAALSIKEGSYPPTVNDPSETAFCVSVAEEIAGAERVDAACEPTMGAEDFSFFALEKPASFMLCGNGATAALHHPRYDFDDTATPWGASYWTRLVERALPVA